jgi:hypothetical protein
MTIDITGDLTPEPVVPRNVSNSEVTTFLSCKRQYNFAFIENLAPKNTSDPLARGSAFHNAMDVYWKKRIEGKDHDTAFNEALVEGFAVLPEGWSLEMLMHAQMLWTRFMMFYNGFPDWKPIGTEIKLTVPMTPTLTISIQYDFYFYNMATKKFVLLDWKVTYEFWKDEDHSLNGQMPKYIAVLQANGYQVDEGCLAEIRSRPLGKEKASDPRNLWRFTRYNPSTAKKQQVIRQHVSASLAIERHRNLSPEDRDIESIPVLNKHGACKFCNFTDLCMAMLEGRRDLSVDIRVGYVHNDYTDIHNEIESKLPNVDF